jgi:DNA repair protein RadC
MTEPYVFVDDAGEIFPRDNPPYGGKRQRFVRAGHLEGLQVEVALVRAPGFSLTKAPMITASIAAVGVIRDIYKNSPQEVFGVILLSARNRVLGVHAVHRGRVTSVEVHPADAFRAALVAGAAALICFHNHPSGDCAPSDDDHALTVRLERAGKILGVPVLDHIITGPEADYYSFADRGLIEGA